MSFLLCIDAIAKEKEELETKDSVQISTTTAKNFTDSPEFISEYQQELKAKMFTAVAEIEKRLDSPECKKNILLVMYQILQANLYAKKMLRRESDNLARAVDALQNEIFAQTINDEQKNIYRTREVYDIIRRQYFGLKKEYERTIDQKFDLQKRIISPQRALAMAKNVFVSGGLKRLRVSIRQHKKDEQRLAQNIIAVTQSEKIFQSRDWSADSRSTFLQEKYLFTKQKTLIEVEKARLANLKISIDQKQAELESLYQKPDLLKKIELIAAGILRKDYKFVRRLEEIETRIKNLSERKNHAKEQLDALKIRLTLDKPNTCYKVNYSDNSSGNSLAAIIAAQLVARFGGDNFDNGKGLGNDE